MPYVQAGDIRLHYVEHGIGPEPLVFIHGYTGTSASWRKTLPLLPDRYHAYAFDLRGAGESHKPESGHGPAVYAEDIDRATRALGLDRFTYIGHSMGGVTGMQFALMFPERLNKLVLVAPAPSDGIQTPSDLHDQARSVRRNREVRRTNMLAMAVRPLTDDDIDKSIESDWSWSEAAWEEAWQAMAGIRVAARLSEIQTPTLMVVGDRDGLRPANLADAQRIPNCALQVFYRVGHSVQRDVPEEFVALLDDFLQHGTAPAQPAATPVTSRAG